MLEYNDVYIVPQYSEVSTRSSVDTSLILDPLLNKRKIDVPVISANMDSVTDGFMAKSISDAGAVGAIHRFMPIQKNVEEFLLCKNSLAFVSVGVNNNSKERASALYQAGARYFIIDIAHGHSKLMKDMITWMRNNFSDVFIVGGNVATYNGTLSLIDWGADAVKCGIGPGAACLTKNVTGVTVPQFTAIRECVRAANESGKDTIVIADGGVREIGDIAKALGAGADLVMSGRMFASCSETPLPGVYRGMASKDAMKTIRNVNTLPTPEGKTMEVEQSSLLVANLIKDIKGGLQSAFSYSNAKTLSEFHAKCLFGFRR